MKYILDERYRLRGWQNAHTGVYDTLRKEPKFLPKEQHRRLPQFRADGRGRLLRHRTGPVLVL